MVECQSCGMNTGGHLLASAAIRIWNKRVPLSPSMPIDIHRSIASVQGKKLEGEQESESAGGSCLSVSPIPRHLPEVLAAMISHCPKTSVICDELSMILYNTKYRAPEDMRDLWDETALLLERRFPTMPDGWGLKVVNIFMAKESLTIQDAPAPVAKKEKDL